MKLVSPAGVILTGMGVAFVLFFRDALILSISRPGRRFTSIHPWEIWLHPLKVLALAGWLWVAGATSLDRPLFSFLPAPAVAALGWAGAAMAVGGISFSCWAKMTLGAQFASRVALHEAHLLVMTGPYLITRHPIYTGVLLLLWGVVLALNSVAALLIWGMLFTSLMYLHTVAEEELLLERYGDLYRTYQRRVPRLLPFV
ncbi:MAG TPA: isoprenylcysteine carboxylmethyltransferase family protein [Candidatus Polarisedimenticolia bacterium]|jgi:protein-S-isoprenylcysteine O-methyltransferase Ste14